MKNDEQGRFLADLVAKNRTKRRLVVCLLLFFQFSNFLGGGQRICGDPGPPYSAYEFLARMGIKVSRNASFPRNIRKLESSALSSGRLFPLKTGLRNGSTSSAANIVTLSPTYDIITFYVFSNIMLLNEYEMFGKHYA